MIDAPQCTDATQWIDDRRGVLRERLADVEARLVAVREARSDWTDEEHDPEGFALTFEWQAAEGAHAQHLGELLELDRAADRVAAATYGRCDSCRGEIPVEQLRLRPARTTCVACTDDVR